MVGPLTALRQRADGGDPAPDDAEVERRDRHRPGDGAGGLGAGRQDRGEDRGPAEREPEVDRHGGGEQHGGPALARQDDRAGGAPAGEHVVAAQQRPRGGGQGRAGRPRDPRGERVGGQRAPRAGAGHPSGSRRPRGPGRGPVTLARTAGARAPPSPRGSAARPRRGPRRRTRRRPRRPRPRAGRRRRATSGAGRATPSAATRSSSGRRRFASDRRRARAPVRRASGRDGARATVTPLTAALSRVAATRRGRGRRRAPAPKPSRAAAIASTPEPQPTSTQRAAGLELEQQLEAQPRRRMRAGAEGLARVDRRRRARPAARRAPTAGARASRPPTSTGRWKAFQRSSQSSAHLGGGDLDQRPAGGRAQVGQRGQLARRAVDGVLDDVAVARAPRPRRARARAARRARARRPRARDAHARARITASRRRSLPQRELASRPRRRLSSVSESASSLEQLALLARSACAGRRR